MKNNKLFVISVVEIAVGIAIDLLAFAGVVRDTSVFAGIGSGILAVGLAQLLRAVRMEATKSGWRLRRRMSGTPLYP